MTETTNRKGGDATQKLLAFASLITLVVVFSILSENFRTISNMMNILQATSVTGVLAVSATLVIITGGIDLSVGTAMTFTAVTAGMLLTWVGLPIPLGVLGAVLMGALTGLTSGLFITKLRIPPFIATLGMMLVLKGLSLIVTANKPIYFNDSPGFTAIAQGSLLGKILPFLPVPNGVVALFGVAAVVAYVLNRTVLGRYTYALGSNEEATRLSGVNVDGWKMAIYALAGAVTGVAGVLIAARVNSAQPALGQGYELEAIAAVVIGGTSLAGGRGTILGTLIGALIMSVLTNGLRILSVAPEWQIVATGVIIIGAVYADMLRKKA
ncbi:MAG: ABC transporter permease [Rhodobacteraceae bacterium]|nr:ABC transporter permease [Paracoccaceae bacterium]